MIPVRRTAFTLIEVVVTIAIVAVLVAILAPAVQRVRESAGRTECANQLRQIGLALQQHHDAHKILPVNGGWDGKQTIKSRGGAAVTPATTDLALRATFRWGVGDPVLPPRRQAGSWLFSILPFVEQEAVFRTRSWETPVALYICGSRRAAVAYPVAERDAYGVYESGGWSWGKTDYAGNAQVISGLALQSPLRIRRLADLTDGTSQTLLVGEKAYDPEVHGGDTWYWDEPFFLGGSAGTARAGIGVLRDGPGIAFRNNWGSPHAGGAMFIFADGSTRQVAYDVSWSTMAALLSPSGGEIVPSSE